ncbi:MAG: alkaline phosphatase, partial [Flavobacteriaceae bacterium]|nr:alkaline phosphatase [Flavobacteriaceae bacterium]
ATNSADAICTDSAAGATAFATGTKSNNRAIGVDRFGNDIENVTELLATKGYTNAIITTDEITGATPAAFYAHVKDRAMEMKILKQLEEEAPIEYFIASGQKNHPKYNKLKYSFTDWHLAQPKESAMSIRYFKNRMDLSAATTEMLAKLQNNNHAFFLLLEGANIDNSGHANRLAPMIEALYSFDLAVAQALQYAFL